MNNTSIFSAELTAILKAIQLLPEKSQENSFTIFTDSKSAVFEIKKLYPTNSIAMDPPAILEYQAMK